jgi:hypothetical protein
VLLHASESIRVYPGQPLIAKQVDRGDLIRRVLYAARDAYYQVMIQRPAGGSGPIAGGPTTAGGAQGDKGKTGDAGKTGTTTGPGAPPAGPGAPPPGPGQ